MLPWCLFYAYCERFETGIVTKGITQFCINLHWQWSDIFFKFNFISSWKWQSPPEDFLVTDFFSDHAQNSTATESIFVYSSVQVLIQMHCLPKMCFNNLELAYFSCLFLAGILIQLLVSSATCVSRIHQEWFSQDVSEIYSVYT